MLRWLVITLKHRVKYYFKQLSLLVHDPSPFCNYNIRFIFAGQIKQISDYCWDLIETVPEYGCPLYLQKVQFFFEWCFFFLHGAFLLILGFFAGRIASEGRAEWTSLFLSMAAKLAEELSVAWWPFVLNMLEGVFTIVNL